MASITIRRLDEQLKSLLRLRAAQNGRSMEDEARTILRDAASGSPPPAARARPAAARRASTSARAEPVETRAASRVLLIIGGGIAAYKSLDLIRRLKERGLAVRCILTAAAKEFIAPLSAAALSGEQVFTELFD